MNYQVQRIHRQQTVIESIVHTGEIDACRIVTFSNNIFKKLFSLVPFCQNMIGKACKF